MSQTSGEAPVVTVTPFVAADGHAILLTDRAADAIKHLPDREAAFRIYAMGQAWTLRVDDVPVGAAGLLPLWPGVSSAWLLPSAALAQYPKSVAVAVVTHTRELIQSQGLWRVQCTVQADHVLGRRFVEWLGFEPESTMRAYGPHGEDHIGYAWIDPEKIPVRKAA